MTSAPASAAVPVDLDDVPELTEAVEEIEIESIVESQNPWYVAVRSLQRLYLLSLPEWNRQRKIHESRLCRIHLIKLRGK